MTQITLNDLIDLAPLLFTIAGAIGSTSALVVDFMRRRVRSKAAEYAARDDFQRISNGVAILQDTIEKQIAVSNQNHTAILERVAHLEGRFNSNFKD